MKNSFKYIFLKLTVGALLAFGSVAIYAQEDATAREARDLQPRARQPQNAASLLRQLNLTPEQIEKIRFINQETRQEIRAANQRHRQTRRALDEAIYKSSSNEAEVEQRTRELIKAQSEATALRARVEFRIRQVLTDEQLSTFLELRRRAAQNLLQKTLRPSQQPAPPPGDRLRRFHPKRTL
jgi:periplasmic protein CpxP/Spy